MSDSENEYLTLDANNLINVEYKEKVTGFGFCIGKNSRVFTKNETMICGLKNIDMADDCLEYTFVNPGYAVGEDTLILPCFASASRHRIVTDTLIMNGSNYQSPNFNLLLMSMMVLFIYYLKR